MNQTRSARIKLMAPNKKNTGKTLPSSKHKYSVTVNDNCAPREVKRSTLETIRPPSSTFMLFAAQMNRAPHEPAKSATRSPGTMSTWANHSPKPATITSSSAMRQM